jgi:hypothetical protein
MMGKEMSVAELAVEERLLVIGEKARHNGRVQRSLDM